MKVVLASYFLSTRITDVFHLLFPSMPNCGLPYYSRYYFYQARADNKDNSNDDNTDDNDDDDNILQCSVHFD